MNTRTLFMLLISLFITQVSIASPQLPESYARVVRRIDLDQLGISNAQDIAFWKDEGVFLLKNGGNPGQGEVISTLSKVTMFRESFSGAQVQTVRMAIHPTGSSPITVTST